MDKYIIEFTGTPEAGKTSAINGLKDYLIDNNNSVIVIEEAATALKNVLKEDSKDKALYITLKTMKEYIEAINSDASYILIDRGLYERFFWNQFSYSRGDISIDELNTREELLTILNNKYKVDLFVCLTVSPNIAITRKGKEGKFVNETWINGYNEGLNLFIDSFDKTEVFKLDTSDLNKEQVIDKLVKKINIK
jgi:thymidylate kinase